MKQYYLKDGTRERGPYLIDDLKYQRVKPSTLVKIDNGNWQPISQVTDLLFLLKDNGGANAYSSATTTAQTNSNTYNDPLNAQQQAKRRVVVVIAIAIAMMVIGLAGAMFFVSAQPK